MKLGIFNRLDPLGRLLLTMALLFSASFAYAESEYAEAWGQALVLRHLYCLPLIKMATNKI